MENRKTSNSKKNLWPFFFFLQCSCRYKELFSFKNDANFGKIPLKWIMFLKSFYVKFCATLCISCWDLPIPKILEKVKQYNLLSDRHQDLNSTHLCNGAIHYKNFMKFCLYFASATTKCVSQVHRWSFSKNNQIVIRTS